MTTQGHKNRTNYLSLAKQANVDEPKTSLKKKKKKMQANMQPYAEHWQNFILSYSERMMKCT